MTNKPRRDAEWIAWAGLVHGKCMENATGWGLDPDTLKEFTRLLGEAKEAYEENAPRATRNSDTVERKRKRFRNLREFFSTFLPILTSNLMIPNNELATMSVKTRLKRSRTLIGVPLRAPAVDIIKTGKYKVIARVGKPQIGESNIYVRDDPRYLVLLRYWFEDETKWQEKYSTRLRVLLDFDEKASRRCLLVQAAWTNPRLEAGPWSNTAKILLG